MFIFCYCLARLNMPTPKGQAFVPHRLNLHFAKDMRLLLQLRVQFPSTFRGCTLNRLRCGCCKVCGWVWSKGNNFCGVYSWKKPAPLPTVNDLRENSMQAARNGVNISTIYHAYKKKHYIYTYYILYIARFPLNCAALSIALQNKPNANIYLFTQLIFQSAIKRGRNLSRTTAKCRKISWQRI